MITNKTKVLGYGFVIALILSGVLSGCGTLKETVSSGGEGILWDTPTQTEGEKETGVPAPFWQTAADLLALFGLSGAAVYIRNVKKVANGEFVKVEARLKQLEKMKMEEHN